MKIRRLAPLTGLALLLPLASCSDAVSPEPAAPPLVPAASHACDGSLPWFGTYYVGSDPNANLEVDGKLDTGCGYMVVTGVKGRIVSDSNYETMWLTGRMLYHDGTWGGETTRVYDVDGIVSHSWEMEAKVPDGHAVIGIGIGQVGDQRHPQEAGPEEQAGRNRRRAPPARRTRIHHRPRHGLARHGSLPRAHRRPRGVHRPRPAVQRGAHEDDPPLHRRALLAHDEPSPGAVPRGPRRGRAPAESSPPHVTGTRRAQPPAGSAPAASPGSSPAANCRSHRRR